MANEMIYAQALRQDPTPAPEMVGTGMASEAGKDMGGRTAKYKRYAAETMMEGSSPMTYEEWIASQ